MYICKYVRITYIYIYISIYILINMNYKVINHFFWVDLTIIYLLRCIIIRAILDMGFYIIKFRIRIRKENIHIESEAQQKKIYQENKRVSSSEDMENKY